MSINERRPLLVWDTEGFPTSGDWTTVLWNSFDNGIDPGTISIPSLVEEQADVLKSRYLAWVYELGETLTNGKRVVDHLELRPGFSYWWMTSLAQKFNASGSSQIDNAIKSLVLERLICENKPTSILLVSGNDKLAKVIQIFCKNQGLSFLWKPASRIEEPHTSVARHIYSTLPSPLRALIYFLWYFLRSFTFLCTKKESAPVANGEITFVDVLVHLNANAFRTGTFVSNYWTALVDELLHSQVKTNWLHNYFSQKTIPDFAHAYELTQCFNKSSRQLQAHILIESNMTLSLFLKVLKDYVRISSSGFQVSKICRHFRPSGSAIDFWPLFRQEWIDSLRGQGAIVNCLRFCLYEKTFSMLPYQKLGVYIQENQPWEMSLAYAWKVAGHGKLVGIPHASVRFWDLRYFYDPRSYIHTGKNFLPIPDLVAVNGCVAKKAYLGCGYPESLVTEVEALRFFHLLDLKHTKDPVKYQVKVLTVLICGDFISSSNHKILSWLAIAARFLPPETNFIFKPHPACPVDFSCFPSLQLQTTNAPLSELFGECDVFLGNITTASVDAYCSGIPVVQMLDGSTLNMSPLRGLKGVMYATTPSQLAEELRNAQNREHVDVEPYFYLDEALPRWRELLGVQRNWDKVSNPYVATDLAFVVPTKDRHAQLERLLESLARQTQTCGRIVVVDGGTSAERVVSGFQGRLAVDYLHCPVPGQIRQRNLGIEALGTRYRLVGFLDDDLVLESDALEKMIEFWNRAEGGTAGVGFNITNVEPLRHSPLLGLFFMSVNTPGKVLKSGYNVGFANITSDIRVQWLGGGYTVWRSSILQQFPQETLNTRWAIGEDLRFSYPIGKKYPLAVCADARVRHEHVFDQGPPKKIHLYRGRKSVVSQFYFAQLHAGDFSRIACLWMLLGKCIFRFVRACLKADGQSLLQAIGEVNGFLVCFRSALTSKDLRMEMED